MQITERQLLLTLMPKKYDESEKTIAWCHSGCFHPMHISRLPKCLNNGKESRRHGKKSGLAEVLVEKETLHDVEYNRDVYVLCDPANCNNSTLVFSSPNRIFPVLEINSSRDVSVQKPDFSWEAELPNCYCRIEYRIISAQTHNFQTAEYDGWKEQMTISVYESEAHYKEIEW